MDDEELHIISFTTGDWSDDGHGKTSTKMFLSNITSSMAAQALKTAIEDLNLPSFGDILSLCSEYEDRNIPEEYHQILGVIPNPNDFDSIIVEAWEGKVEELEKPNNWFYINIRLIQHTLPHATFEPIEGNNINIGGYGLFY